MKNVGQSNCSANQPPPEAKNVLERFINDVRSAYWVAVYVLLQSKDKYAINAVPPIPLQIFSMEITQTSPVTDGPIQASKAYNKLVKAIIITPSKTDR